MSLLRCKSEQKENAMRNSEILVIQLTSHYCHWFSPKLLMHGTVLVSPMLRDWPTLDLNFILILNLTCCCCLPTPLTIVFSGGVLSSRLWSTSQLLRPYVQQFCQSSGVYPQILSDTVVHIIWVQLKIWCVSCVWVLQRGLSSNGCNLASTLCKYDLRKGDLFVLSWTRVRQVRRRSISLELLMYGGGVRIILIFPLVYICLETIDVCMWRMFDFMYVVVTVWGMWECLLCSGRWR